MHLRSALLVALGSAALAAAPGTFAAGEPDAAGAPRAFAVPGCWESSAGVSLHLDNDLLAGGPHDADYTGGFALHVTPRRQDRHYLPHRLHRAVDRALGLGGEGCRRHVWQLGLFSLTPGTLRSSVPVVGDRPFASLLVAGSTALWSGDSEDVVLQSTLQFGALGWDLAEGVHAALHRLVDDERPQGYQYQVSDGGEPTVRYVLARHQLLRDVLVRGETLQLKSTMAVSAGYLTEGSVGLSARWGRVASPWQTFTPELADYLPTPAPLSAGGGGALYAFAGVRLKLRAYNALVQGQLRDSTYVLSSAELERWLGEAYVGLHWQPSPEWEFTYVFRVHTPELRNHPARRALVWGGIEIARRF